MVRRAFRWILLALIVGGILYIPIHRELVDRGVLQAGRYQAKTGERLTVYGNGKYELSRGGRKTRGTFTIEKFPDAPWISLLRLDIGLVLHVPYDGHVYRLEDVPELDGADVKFSRV
jgi:hypothetical protein